MTPQQTLRRALGGLLLCASIAAAAGPAQAQEPAPTDELPPADELIAAYVEAIGGVEAHSAPTSIRTSGAVLLPAMGLEGEFELIQIPSVGTRMTTSIPGIGEMLVGFDGEVGWSMNAMAGPSLMGEAEREQIEERAQLAATLRSPEAVLESETVERTEVRAQDCYRVRHAWASGRETFDCYSVETGLLVASEDVQVNDMGEVPVMTYFSEYEEVAGMNLPRRLVQEAMGIQQVMEIESVVIDDATVEALAPPEAIRTLMEEGPGGG